MAIRTPAAPLPILIAALALALAACAPRTAAVEAPAAQPRPVQSFPGTAAARSADQLDTTTEAERQAAMAAAPAGGQELGRVRVSLGSPAEQGFWLKSPLVAQAGQGTVSVAGGASVAVGLRPGAGAAQLSLAAYRALGLPLTGLPEVTVTAD